RIDIVGHADHPRAAVAYRRLVLEEDIEGILLLCVGPLLGQLLLGLQAGLELPGLLCLGRVEVHVLPVFVPVGVALLQNQREDEERDAVVVREGEAGALELVAVPLRQLLPTGDNIVPALGLAQAGILEQLGVDQHAAVLEVVLVRDSVGFALPHIG